MSGAILPLSQYAFIAWCLVKAKGQLYLYFLPLSDIDKHIVIKDVRHPAESISPNMF